MLAVLAQSSVLRDQKKIRGIFSLLFSFLRPAAVWPLFKLSIHSQRLKIQLIFLNTSLILSYTRTLSKMTGWIPPLMWRSVPGSWQINLYVTLAWSTPMATTLCAESPVYFPLWETLWAHFLLLYLSTWRWCLCVYKIFLCIFPFSSDADAGLHREEESNRQSASWYGRSIAPIPVRRSRDLLGIVCVCDVCISVHLEDDQEEAKKFSPLDSTEVTIWLGRKKKPTLASIGWMHSRKRSPTAKALPQSTE